MFNLSDSNTETVVIILMSAAYLELHSILAVPGLWQFISNIYKLIVTSSVFPTRLWAKPEVKPNRNSGLS